MSKTGTTPPNNNMGNNLEIHEIIGQVLSSRSFWYAISPYRIYTYIPLDNTYVIFQMIVTFLIIIFGGITYLAVYQSQVPDVIESLKNTVINTHLITLLILTVLNVLTNFFSKNKSGLIKKLFVILIISVLTLIIFWGVKVNLNSKYNESKFEQIYEESYIQDYSGKKTKIDFGFSGLQLKDEREYFISENVKMYTMFNIKTYGIIVLNSLLIGLCIFQISKAIAVNEKQEQLKRDDAIVYDEEENIKF